ncbi:MAG: hypothetical protein HY687_01265 [Chloroflexi bacterium]|nr:hypothetical protein [Chloroflexota bacterium]
METVKVDPRDLVLAIVAFNADSRVVGRTFLQKLAYFLNEKLKLGVEFEPHYYGPYSESIAMATKSLVALDFLVEAEERLLVVSSDIYEPRRYTYDLTLAGRGVLDGIKQYKPALFKSIESGMREITSKEDCNYECLSLAAKTIHILKSQGKPMKDSELSIAAKDLGWKLGEKELDRAAKFLKDLGLIEVS